jgi:hypothetical protein
MHTFPFKGGKGLSGTEVTCMFKVDYLKNEIHFFLPSIRNTVFRDEIAAITKVRIGTVKSRLHYGKKRAQALLEEYR